MDLFFVPHLRKVESRVYLSVILECSFDHVKHASFFPFTDLNRGIICTSVCIGSTGTLDSQQIHSLMFYIF